MNTSEPSASIPAGKHSHGFLIRLFWQARVMDRWRKVPSMVVRVADLPSMEAFAAYLFAQDPSIRLVRPDIDYHFEAHQWGDQWWVAVVCEDKVIVPPFLVATTPSEVPYFPEELACSPSR